jgi:hypothetical protein
MDYNWKCIGVTHEYWNGENKKSLNKDIIYINDVGDGCCKSDKISRDIRLLEQGIKVGNQNINDAGKNLEIGKLTLEDANKQIQWKAFQRTVLLQEHFVFEEILECHGDII